MRTIAVALLLLATIATAARNKPCARLCRHDIATCASSCKAGVKACVAASCAGKHGRAARACRRACKRACPKECRRTVLAACAADTVRTRCEAPPALTDVTAPTASPSELTVDPQTSLPTSRTRLLVLLADGAGRDVANAAVAAAGSRATLIGSAPELGTIVIAIPDSADLTAIRAARDAAARVPSVVAAMIDTGLGPTSLPPTDPATTPSGPDPSDSPCRPVAPFAWAWDRNPAGANWGQEWAAFPSAWSWNDFIRAHGGSVAVGMVDAGTADDGHPDLAGVVGIVGGSATADHPTHVAGIIAATFADKNGINGATPFAHIASEGLGSTSAIGTIGDLMLTYVRQLVRHAGVRVINVSLGNNWKSNQADSANCLYTVVPPSPNVTPAQQRVVETQAILALRQARFLAVQTPPVFLSVAAGNDSIAAAEISPSADANSVQNAVDWERVDARWSNPYCHAAIVGGAPNVFCVEAIQQTADRASVNRTRFSNVGGTVSAPGQSIGSTITGARYSQYDGTSMAAPLVTGLIAHMLAYKPDLTVDELRGAILNGARAGGADTAPGIDAFKAMVALADAKKVLMDVDDGTDDGCDRSIADDAHGNGSIDMRDFRRVRDGFLWVSNRRDLLDAGAGIMKMDLNQDGVLDDFSPAEVYPRFDFDGDGILTNADIDVMSQATELWSDADVPASALPSLKLSADLHLDGSALFDQGATDVLVSADGAPHSVHVTPGANVIYTVPATLPAGDVTLRGEIVSGPDTLTMKTATVTAGAGQDLTVALQPGEGCHLDVSNVDDHLTVSSNGQPLLTVDYGGSGGVDLPCKGSIDVTLVNDIGGYTYTWQLTCNDQIFASDTCGVVGTIGCNGNDYTLGTVYTRSVQFDCQQPL